MTIGGYSNSILVSNQPPKPTQSFTLSGIENEYRTKHSDARWLGSKGRYNLFHLLINMWVVSASDMSIVYKVLYKSTGPLLLYLAEASTNSGTSGKI